MTDSPFDHVSDLLAIIADPKKAEARLKELRDLLEENTKVADAINKTHIETERALDRAHGAEQKARGMADANAAKERDLASRNTTINERGRELEEKYRDLMRQQDAHKESVAHKQAELDKRERAVAGLEIDRAKLVEDRRLLDEQLAKARSFLKV